MPPIILHQIHGRTDSALGPYTAAHAAAIRRAAAVTATAASLSFLSATAFAQAPLAQGAATSYLASARRGIDLLHGLDKTGPYPLSWTGLRLTAEDTPVVVDVDGTDLTPDAYTIDAIKGTITFQTALKSTSLARVEYDYDPIYSQPNPAAAGNATPIVLPSTKLGAGASLQMEAVPTLTGTGSTAESAARMVWALGDKTRIAGGNFTSQLLFGDGGGTYTGIADRSGLDFVYGIGNTNSGLDAHFLRDGEGLAPGAGKTYGMADGKQDWGLAARMHPETWLGATLSTDDTRNLAGNGASGQDTLTLKVGGTKAVQPVLNVQATDTDKSDGHGNGQTASDDKADLAAKLAPTLSLAAKTEVTQTDSTDPTKTGGVQETSVTVDSKDAKGTTTQASLALTDGLKTTENDKEAHEGVTLKLQPAARVTVTVANTQNTVDPTAATVTTVAHTVVQQTSVAAEMTPAPNTKLTTTVQQSVSAGGTAPTDEGTTDNEALDAQVGVNKTVTLTGGVTNRDATEGGIAALDSTRVHLAVAPMPGISVTTGMVVNPEQNGVVSEAKQQDVGLTLKRGAWDLGSAYSMTTLFGAAASDPRGLPMQTGEMKFTLGLKVSRSAQITCAYKNDFQYGNTNPSIAQPPRGLEAYNLNYTHAVGTACTLTVGGAVTNNPANTAEPQDIEATAKLGVKF